MLGQGRPKTSGRRCLPIARKAVAPDVFVAALVLVFLSAGSLFAGEVRIRVAWGGGAERLWQGSISVSEGSLSRPTALGVEADEPGSMWVDAKGGNSSQLIIQSRSARGYDGVDISVHASADAKLKVQLTSPEDPASTVTHETALKDISGEYINKEIDSSGARLLLMRTPGDMLRVDLAKDQLVFRPGELLKFTLEPHLLPLPEDGRAKVKVQLLNGSKELWTKQYDVQAGVEVRIPQEIPLPKEEGVYDVAIAAVNVPNWSQAVRQPMNWKRTIAERRIQLLVLGEESSKRGRNDREFTQVVEIDPANPRWFEKLSKLPQLQLARSRLPRSWKGRLDNSCVGLRQHPLGELVELKPNAESPDVSWEAYWLPVEQPGHPHVLEIDYPSDVPQTLNVSVLEPNAAGALTPIGLNSGFDRGADGADAKSNPRWLKHSLIFWPRTTSPLVMVSNGRERSPAVFGRIRVLQGGPRLSVRPGGERASDNHRLFAAYLDRPLIPENFSANESLDPWSGRSLDDWWTFYEGGTRLVEYLRHIGYNGLMLGVLADGSTIYPSSLLAPTPRYDTGAFFASAQDPIRKDVLEMLFRQFDRENMLLIPTVEFAAPLPELEALRREGNSELQGIEWIGADGASLCVVSPPQRGLAPHYNVLDPRVQKAMLRVLHEVAERYAGHPAFAGLAVRLASDGYAQLPSPEWGMDDATIGRFQRDMRLLVPGRGPHRFAERAAFLEQPANRRLWLEWRAAELSKFYRRVHEELEAIRPGSRLYLAGAGMIAGLEMEAELRPSLPRRTTIAAAMLRVGIDAKHYQDPRRGIVLLRPERVQPQASLGMRAVDLEFGQTTDFDRYFQTAGTLGSLFFHPPREYHVESFDQKTPFKPGYTWLVSQPSPSHQQNRRRFVHSLASLDAQVMVDGGWLLSMGQEDATRGFIDSYLALPAGTFQTIKNRQTGESIQPITFRSKSHGGRTYLYAVNDAPFSTLARIHVDASPQCKIEELTGHRKIAALRPDGESGMYWEVRLEPYDFIAAHLSEPDAKLSNPQASWAENVETAISSQIRQLGARRAVLQNPPPMDILPNADFENQAAEATVPEWAVTTHNGIDIRLDKSVKHGGQQSVHVSSDGGVACLVSRPLSLPSTGRLSMSVWLRVADPEKQPPLRLAIEGKLQGRDYYRFAPIGRAPGTEQASVAIGSQWGQYIFQVDDLPFEGLSAVRVRFDLMGEGDVWIDDVQLYSLAFNKTELVELAKLITLADMSLQNGQIGDCLRLLDGYWPRFLEENVPLPAGAAMDTTASRPRTKEEPPPDRSGWLNRVKDMVPESLRF